MKRVRLFWSLRVVSVNYIAHIKSQKPRRRDTRMEDHESATLMTANDDERVALLLKSGSKRMMTPVSSSFTQKRTAAPTMKAVSIACFVCFCAFAFVSRNHPLKTYLENRLIVQTLGVKPIALVQVMSFPCGKCVFHIPGMVHACSHQRALPVSQQVLHGG